MFGFLQGRKLKCPKIPERGVFGAKEHFEMNNSGVERTYYGMRSHYYWIGMKAAIGRVIKDCSICITFHRKRKSRYEFIQTTRLMEKVGLDIMEMKKPDMYEELTITPCICEYMLFKIRVQNIC